MKLLPLMLLIPGASQLQAEILQPQGTFTTVGGNGCQYTKLQEAINAAMQGGSSVIRVVDQTYNENLILDDVDVDIIGGYADCQAASNGNQGDGTFTVNAADLNESVVTITGDQPSTIHLENMNVTGGNGGISNTSVTVQLTTKTVKVSKNSNTGIYFKYGNQTAVLIDTIITGNDGPGLLCIGSSNKVTIKGNSELKENHSQFGGGLAAAFGCSIDAHAPTVISHNQAAAFGGGVLSYDGSTIDLYGVTIESNAAEQGAAVAAYYGEVNMHGVTIQGNGAFIASAFYAIGNNASISITQSTISGNITEVGTTAGAAMFGATVNIENSMVVDNDVNGSTLLAGYQGVLNLKYVTVAGNDELDGSVKLVENGAVNIESSIIHNAVEVVASDDGTGSLDMTCAIINEEGTYDGIETVSVVSNLDTLFVDPLAGDYHLTFNSPAIDYCATAANIDPNYPTDIDGQVRGVDQPDVNNGGIYDLGADAFYTDLIFKDGVDGN